MKKIEEILCQVDDTISMKRFLPIIAEAKRIDAFSSFAFVSVQHAIVESKIVQKHLDCLLDYLDPSFFHDLGTLVSVLPKNGNRLYNQEKRILAEVLFAISSVCHFEQMQYEFDWGW